MRGLYLDRHGTMRREHLRAGTAATDAERRRTRICRRATARIAMLSCGQTQSLGQGAAKRPQGNRATTGEAPVLRNPADRAPPRRARKLALLGFTEVEIAEQFGISPDTIQEWKAKHGEFSVALAEERLARL